MHNVMADDHPENRRSGIPSNIHGPNKKKNAPKQKWSPEELHTMMALDVVKKCLALEKIPSFSDCENMKRNASCLAQRTLIQIKSKVWTMIQKKRKQNGSLN